MRVAVCLVTCRRPTWLAASLDSLSHLAVPPAAVVWQVMVVDNDADASGRPATLPPRPGLPGICYEIEPQRGISFARNHAVRLALAWGADYIAFLDDDEEARPGWLEALLAAQARYQADVVTGPVVPVYEPGVPAWVQRGRFFERPRYASGAQLQCAITANCLIAAPLLANSAEPFHSAFALSGGGDTHFFTRVHDQGARIVWADEAEVQERVPASRATVRWLLRRAYRGGTSFVQSERLLRRGVGWRIIRFTTGLVRSVLGVILLGPALLLGRVWAMRTLQMMAVGAGLLAGLLGMSYIEYTVVHGK